MLNPYIFKVDADLSRADIVALTLLCRNKKVVEFGVGGSTILLSKIASKVISYDTDENWIKKIRDKAPNVDYRLIEKNPESARGLSETCDVLFDDGWSLLRAPFLIEFWFNIKDYAILHDGRMTYAGNCVKVFLDSWQKSEYGQLPNNLYTGSLKTIHWNYLESNMVVLEKRNYTLLYENWNVTEKNKTPNERTSN